MGLKDVVGEIPKKHLLIGLTVSKPVRTIKRCGHKSQNVISTIFFRMDWFPYFLPLNLSSWLGKHLKDKKGILY